MCWGDWYEKTYVLARIRGSNSPWYLTCFDPSYYTISFVWVLPSKVFNEVISTKLYASSWLFSHKGFYTWWLQAYFLLEFNVSFTHDPKALCTPYFSHRVFEEMIYWKTTCRWYWSRGSVTKYCVQSDQPLSDSFLPRDTPLGRHCIHCI